MIYKVAYRKPQKASAKPPVTYKKNQGRNPYNIFVTILVETMTPKRHFEIKWPLEFTLHENSPTPKSEVTLPVVLVTACPLLDIMTGPGATWLQKENINAKGILLHMGKLQE